jgi:D-alanyl-lipoteichoic acid acyltransferase DltB (MBOAT superfamily)
MLFNSIEFLVFCPLVFLLYWIVKGVKWQNVVLLAASLCFYGWWDARFLLLIAIVCFVSYHTAIFIEKSQCQGRKGRWWLLLCATVTLGILGLFKYYNFFVENFVQLLGSVGVKADVPTLYLILPVGISFYTFQSLGYCIDVYRKTIRATHNALDYFTFIAFFPQLVAGPIERASHMLPQIQRVRAFSYETSVSGLRLMLWGFFKKCIVADCCATVVDSVFAAWGNYSSLELFVAAFLFSIQIYADFSGYCDIAVGTARLFGVQLTMNFRMPYFSVSIKDFWRRWHISLMTWFRDYVYIPLGGNRKGRFHTICNVFCVFLLSGLWHGAMWTFVLWGAWHAMWLTIHNSVSRVSFLPMKSQRKQVVGVLVTFIIVLFGWIIFRAPSVSEAIQYTVTVVNPVQWSVSYQFSRLPLFWSALMLISEFAGRNALCPLDLLPQGDGPNRAVRLGVYYVLILVILLFANSGQEFIYFQF